jgi:hypothetical protein
MEPPRPVLRWYADSGPRPPGKLLPASGKPSRVPPAQQTKPPRPPARGLASRIKSLFRR